MNPEQSGLRTMILNRLADAKREVEAAMKNDNCDELFQDHIQRATIFLREVEAMFVKKPTGPVYRTIVKESEPDDRRSRE
jgi:hypothetical protein